MSGIYMNVIVFLLYEICIIIKNNIQHHHT